MVVAVLVVISGAARADAHAVLLRTDPSPQSAVKRAPIAVTLTYSEAVEASFGAVRVYDVNAHRVDQGTIRRRAGNRQLVVPLRAVKNGTFTVTWRVVSSDGHAVHGGYVFYVGGPSAISPAAVPETAATSRPVAIAFGAVRFVWFAGLLGLIGIPVVRRWVWLPAARHVGPETAPAVGRFRRTSSRALLACWAVVAVTGTAALGLEAATVAGLSLTSALGGSVLGSVLATTWGHYWVASMAITGLAIVPVVALVSTTAIPSSVALALLAVADAGLCVVSALTGHARTFARPAIGVASLAVHLGAVGVWAGGLAAVVGLGIPSWRAVEGRARAELVPAVVSRFSRLALAAVAVVFATGLVNAVLDLGAVGDLWRTTYGQLVAVKVVLLAVAVALAARHRRVLRIFELSASLEALVLAGALAVASALVATVPGRSLDLQPSGTVSQEHVAAGFRVQFFLDPSRVGANQLHLTFLTPDGLAAGQVDRAEAGLAGAAPRSVSLRLIAPGHFVGDVEFPAAARYRLVVAGHAGGARIPTTFSFRIR